MSDASDRLQYQQYLEETGQAAPLSGSGISGPNPELSPTTAGQALGDIAHQTPPGSRTFIPQEEQHPVEGVAPLAAPAGVFPALGKLAEFLNSNAATRAATGAVQGAVTDPNHPGRGALVGAGASLGVDSLAGLLGKGGDYAMQIAVNRKKYTPGVGTALADEGLWGTKNAMKGQVEQGLANRGQQMQDIAAQIPGTPISARNVGSGISEEVAGGITGRGKIPVDQISEADLPDYNKIQSFANDVSSRGDQSVADALARRQAAGARAWRGKEDPANSLVGKLSKAEQQGYSSQIKAADPTGQMAEADAAYGALKRAQKGLDQEAPLPKSMFGAATYGANNLPGGTLAASTAGQLGTKSSQALSTAAPILRQGAINGVKSLQDLIAPPDYDQYLKETGQK